jgi:DNA repair protein RadC
MDTGNQHKEDCAKLAGLVERFTGIPKAQTFFFVMQNAAADLLPCANIVCETDLQREKLAALFEFKNLYETVKGAEKSREYVLSSTSDAMAYFKNYYADMNDKERFSATFLDSQNRVIATKTISSGTVNESSVHPREIVKEALFHNAVSVMVAHNHPGGAKNPSQPDLFVTDRIKRSIETIGVNLLDHIIVAGDKSISLADMGLMPQSSPMPEIAKAASPVREESSSYKPESRQPSIKQQLAAGKKHLAAERTAAPARAVAKIKSNALEV